MDPFRLYAATGDAVAQLDSLNGETVVASLNLEGRGVMCVAVDPHDPRRIFVGTFDRGIYRSRDGGDLWESVGSGMADARVLSIAISPCDRVNGRSVVYAGTEPSMLYRSEDDGDTWQPSPTLTELPSAPTWSFPPRPYTHHVRWIALHPTDPAILYVGIELGGVMVTRDGGATWEDRKPGSQYDAHAIATHPAAPDRVYEAAGGGVAVLRRRWGHLAPRGRGHGPPLHLGSRHRRRRPRPLVRLRQPRRAHRPPQQRRRPGHPLPQAAMTRPGNRSAETAPDWSSPLPYMPYALLAPRGRPEHAHRRRAERRSVADRRRRRHLAHPPHWPRQPPGPERERNIDTHRSVGRSSPPTYDCLSLVIA